MTKIFGCDQQKISKSSELPEALGALDELNAFLGFVKVQATKNRESRKRFARCKKIFLSSRRKLPALTKN